MNLKYILTFLIFIVVIAVLIIAFSELPQNNNIQNQASFLDDLSASVFGHGTSSESKLIGCSPDFINFNISLHKGEMFKYSKISFNKDYGDVVLSSSYFVIGEEYKDSTRCYNIEYKTQEITRYESSKRTELGEVKSSDKDITIGEDNGTFLLCEGANVSCKEYITLEHPFFGIIYKNFKIIAKYETQYEHKYGLHTIKGEVYPKTEIRVIGEEKLNGKDTYTVEITVEIIEEEKKGVKTEIFLTSYLWIDINSGVIIKRDDYAGKDKLDELKLIF